MNFELFNNFKDDREKGGFVQQFIDEIKNFLLNIRNEKNEKEFNISDEIATIERYPTVLNSGNTKARQGLRQEGCIYAIDVDGADSDIVYMINTETGMVEQEQYEYFPKEMEEYICGDHVFIFENGQYIYNHELTDEYMSSFVSIPQAEKAQEKFSNEFYKNGLDSETRFKISAGNRKKDETVTLSYRDKEGNIKEIEAPSLLIPYFVYDFTILKYDTESECFYKDN